MADNSMMDDLIPEERNEQNRVLIQQLRGTYSRDAEDAQALARMRERLLQSRTSSSIDPVYSQIDEMGPYAKPVSSRGGPSRSSRDFHGASRWQHLSTIAAVLCAVLLVGSFILLLTHAHPTGTGRVKPENTPAATGKHAGPITYIHMLDANTGWAVTYNTNRILHTTAGVTHWQDVTPPVDSQSSILAGTDFFNRSTAWVAVIDGTRLFVYRTHDGGQSWQKAQPPDQSFGNFQIFFLNAQVGWMMVGKGAAAGSEAVDVLHTSDGGVTWQIVSVTSYTNNRPTALPFGGDKSGISFVSTTTGWAAGLSATSNFIWLYVTHDSGATWQHQSIPLAGNADGGQIATLPPVFFNATDGILPVVLSGPQSQTLNIYVTHNGGASWSATTPVPTGAIAGTIDFIDATHGWLVGNTYATASNQYENSTVYRTGDGGHHWTRYTVRLNADITMIDFVSQARGWAIDSAQVLYQTTDGGQTWTKVN